MRNKQKVIVKQLIIATTLLLFDNTLEAIQYPMIVQFISYDNKILQYLEHTLYILEKTKITFQQYWWINSRLYWLTFNYSKFYAIIHFVYFIRDYDSTVNYDIAHNEIAYQYLLKVFHNKINKKGYIT